MDESLLGKWISINDLQIVNGQHFGQIIRANGTTCPCYYNGGFITHIFDAKKIDDASLIYLIPECNDDEMILARQSKKKCQHFCTFCGTRYLATHNFCGSCGKERKSF